MIPFILAFFCQVDVDQVLRLVEEGSAKAETVIKGQYELLSAAIERERRTKRELVSLFAVSVPRRGYNSRDCLMSYL